MSSQLDALRAYVAARPAAPARQGAEPVAAGVRVLVVGSGKGGAGTSTCAAMLALAAAAAGERTLLVDGDEHVGPQRWLLGVGGIEPTLGTDAATGGLAALRGGAAVDALLVPVSATLTLLPGGGADGRALEGAERRVALRRAAACFAGYDVVVVDAGSRLDAVAAALDAASLADDVRLLVVAGREPVALAAAHALVKACAERAPEVGAHVLAARVDAAEAAALFERLAEASRRFLDRPLRLAGAVPDDPCLAAALRGGMPLPDAASGSPAAAAVETLAAGLLAARSPAPSRAPVPRPASLAR